MNNKKALIIYMFVALVALLIGMFLNAEAGWITLVFLFVLATSFIMWRQQLANPLDLDR